MLTIPYAINNGVEVKGPTTNGSNRQVTLYNGAGQWYFGWTSYDDLLDLPILGTISGQDANNVNISGGTLNGVTITGLSSPTNSGDAATKGYVDSAVTGLWDFKGAINCSANPNYPAGAVGDAYVISSPGKIGGASGKSVDSSDMLVCIANNAGGNEASVGSSWVVLEHNLVGALLAANNLSDLTDPAAARTNIGLGNVQNVNQTNASNISSGVLGSNFGGAGSVTGILKANGSGVVSAATAGVDYGVGTVTSVGINSSLTGGPITTTGTLGINLTNANTWTAAQTIQLDNIGTTRTLSRLNTNTTAATSLLNQDSPYEGFFGHYYSGGDKTADWRIFTAGGNLVFANSDNGLTLGNIVSVTPSGVLAVANGLFSNSVATALLTITTNTNQISWSNRGILTSPAAGGIQLGGTNDTTVVAQTLSVQSASGSANVAGQNLTITGSSSTGNATPGSIILQLGTTGTVGGTTTNPFVTACTIAPSGTNSCSVTWTNAGDFTIGTGSRFLFGNARGILTSPANNQIQLGGSDGSSVNAQMLRVASIGINTTNGNAADFTIRQSTPSGSGTPGNFVHSAGASALTSTQTVTINNSSPSAATFTCTNHGFTPGQPVKFTSTNTLPSPLSTGAVYYVLTNSLTANTFQVSVNSYNTASPVVTTSAGSGTHSVVGQNNQQNADITTVTFGPSGLTGSQAIGLAAFQQYWNTSGTPTAINLNVFDLASNAASRLLGLQVSGSDKFVVNKSGDTTLAGKLIVSNSQTPSSAADTGTAGQIAWDSSFLYVCTATNTWKRVGIATW